MSDHEPKPDFITSKSRYGLRVGFPTTVSERGRPAIHPCAIKAYLWVKRNARDKVVEALINPQQVYHYVELSEGDGALFKLFHT